MTAEPTRMSVFCTRRRDAVGDELVERLDVVRDPADDHAGAVALVVAEREPLQVAEEPVAEVGQDPLARPAGEVRLRGARRPGSSTPGRDERDDEPGQELGVAAADAVVDRDLREERRRERGQRRCEQRAERERRAAACTARSAARASRRAGPCASTTSPRTSAPRCIERWPPGCQTLIGRRRRTLAARAPGYGRRPLPWPIPARAGRTRPRRLRAKAACRAGRARRLHALGELALEQAVLVDVAVDRARGDQLVVRAARGDPAVVEDDELVRERDRREPVGDDDRRPLAHRPRAGRRGSAPRSSRRPTRSRRRGSGCAGRAPARARSRAAGAGRPRA